MTTQQKFMAALERLAEKHDVDLVTDHTYSNTGEVAFQPYAAFQPLLTFRFNFQTGYASFSGDDLGDSKREQRWSYVTAKQNDRHGRHRTLDEFLSRVAELLSQAKEAA